MEHRQPPHGERQGASGEDGGKEGVTGRPSLHRALTDSDALAAAAAARRPRPFARSPSRLGPALGRDALEASSSSEDEECSGDNGTCGGNGGKGKSRRDASAGVLLSRQEKVVFATARAFDIDGSASVPEGDGEVFFHMDR